ncbi:hypothetical protein LCGC14_1766140 [marine sediment metagenome]|uniref:Uncharacterized protein n=1 Tax=marine sediment metagenome TaxID=412755 RepID=A0A0F9GZN9_9ZZZZ
MRPEPIQINRALPEEICEHREWNEPIRVRNSSWKYDNDPGQERYFCGSSLINHIKSLASVRAEEIRLEMLRHWDYLRIMPVVEGSDNNIPKEVGWFQLKIYARAYRLKPMNNAKAAIARGLIGQILDGTISPDKAVEIFKNGTGGLTQT